MPVCTRALRDGLGMLRVAKTSRYSPSPRSPKCCSRIVAARAESVPGTPKPFERSGFRRVEAAAPANRRASQTAMVERRKRSTTRVLRANSGSSGREASRPPRGRARGMSIEGWEAVTTRPRSRPTRPAWPRSRTSELTGRPSPPRGCIASGSNRASNEPFCSRAGWVRRRRCRRGARSPRRRLRGRGAGAPPE
jgi:hypothetical protein